MPRNAEVIRQWNILREIERSRASGVTIDALAALCDVTTRTIRRDLQASLTMERAGIRQSFTTRNVMQRPDWMSLELVNGPFKRLDGLWTFAAIGAAGTKVVLDMKFEFANPVASMLFGRAFEQSVGELIDAFVARARQVHGAEP